MIMRIGLDGYSSATAGGVKPHARITVDIVPTQRVRVIFIDSSGSRCSTEAADVRHSAVFRFRKRLDHRGYKWAKSRDIVARRVDDDYSDRHARKILLVLEVTINGEKNVESRRSKAQHLAVLHAGPSGLSHGADFVSGKLRSQSARNALVKKYAHRRGGAPSPVQGRRPLSLGSRSGNRPEILRESARPRCSQSVPERGPAYR